MEQGRDSYGEQSRDSYMGDREDHGQGQLEGAGSGTAIKSKKEQDMDSFLKQDRAGTRGQRMGYCR